jgi:ferritin
MPLSLTTREELGRRILKDLQISQSSASSIALRLDHPEATVNFILRHLVAEQYAETGTVADIITVYRITTKGLEFII